jgi:hypothetical protein
VTSADEGNEPPKHSRNPDTGDPAALYRQNAQECLRAAQAAADATVRDEWIELAGAWTNLALRAAG